MVTHKKSFFHVQLHNDYATKRLRTVKTIHYNLPIIFTWCVAWSASRRRLDFAYSLPLNPSDLLHRRIVRWESWHLFSISRQCSWKAVVSSSHFICSSTIAFISKVTFEGPPEPMRHPIIPDSSYLFGNLSSHFVLYKWNWTRHVPIIRIQFNGRTIIARFCNDNYNNCRTIILQKQNGNLDLAATAYETACSNCLATTGFQYALSSYWYYDGIQLNIG